MLAPDYDSLSSRDTKSAYKSPNEETEQPKRKLSRVKTGKLIDLEDIVDGKGTLFHYED